MPIYTRTGANVTAQHLLPTPLLSLFEKVLPMGTIMEKQEFKKKHLPGYEQRIVKVSELDISIRPAWVDYHDSPHSHLIIVGHILFCHINPDQSWYYQPSTRLFSEDPKSREAQFKKLISRATHKMAAVNYVKVSDRSHLAGSTH